MRRDFDNELKQRLEALDKEGLRRELRCVESAQGPRIQIDKQALLNFSSNDYLGLAHEPALKEAAIAAVKRYGTGAGASRLICGSLAPHHQLEETLAEFKGTEGVLCFSTGYAAALGTICALLGSQDVIVLDKLVHACIVDAARLSGAKLRIFAHNDLNELEDILKWAEQRHPPASKSKTLVLTESVFSMDGDHAPLRELVALKEKHGAWLMLDEAHASGLYGAKRRGLAEETGVADQIEIQMGTLGKAFGASGGYICGSRTLVDYLVNRARSFIFSTAPVPAAAAAAAAGVRLVQSGEGERRCRALWERVTEFSAKLGSEPVLNLPIPTIRGGGNETKHQSLPLGSTFVSPIIPLLVGDETKAVKLAAGLREQGIFIPAIRYPTVARGRARLRLTLTAAHTSGDINTVATALQARRSELLSWVNCGK